MNKYTLKIDGMMCSMCETHVNEIIRKGFNIYKVKSSHSKNEVIFTSDDELSTDEIKKVFQPTGYKILSVNVEKNAKKEIIRNLIGFVKSNPFLLKKHIYSQLLS